MTPICSPVKRNSTQLRHLFVWRIARKAPFMSANLLRQPNFAALVALAWLVVALVLLLQYWRQTAETLLDTDDAMRLVQMRAWLAGQGWFDLHEARVQPPLGYDPHWSRLVDAGLAGLFMIFQLGADALSAERLMRASWPLLWLLPTMAGMVAIAWRIAGRDAAMVALLLALVGVPAYQQFTPGRIDHHNVQIALTLLATAAAAWSDRKRWCAAAAGLLSGLALAIGFECLPYLAACGGALALRYVVDPRRRAGAARLRAGACSFGGARLPGQRRARALAAQPVRRHRDQQPRGGHRRGLRPGAGGLAQLPSES